MKLRYRLLIVVLSLASMLVLMGAGEGNLLDNTAFVVDGGVPTGWEVSGSADFAYRSDREGNVAQMTLNEKGYARLVQNIEVEGGRIYGIRFEARVMGFQGSSGAYAEIVDVPNAKSDLITGTDWQQVELFGMTGKEQTTLPVSFSFGATGAGDIGVAEFRNVQVFLRQDAPTEGSNYVWFYNRDASEEAASAETEEEKNPPNEGFTPALVIAFGYAIFIIVLINYGALTPEVFDTKKKYNKMVWVYILGGMAISMFFATRVFGNQVDVSDFSQWANQLRKTGITGFYASGIWVDYPPGYMYVLYAIGNIAHLLGLEMGSTGYTFLIKLPAILCDAATAFLLYRMSRKYIGGKAASVLAGIMALNPMAIYDSAFWGQIDSILALCIAVSFRAFYKKRKVVSMIAFIVGVLIKPQMLIMGPVLLFAFLKDIFSENWKAELRTLLFALLAGAAVAAAVVIPFSMEFGPSWLLDKYISTGTQYNYASVNAYNIYALLGANWLDYNANGIGGISYFTIGNIAIGLITILTAIYIFTSKERKAIFSGGLFMMWGIFCFSHSMHERYLFPVLVLCAICFAVYRDKRFLYLLGIATAGMLANCVVVMREPHLMGLRLELILISTLNLIGFVGCAYVAWTSHTHDILLAIEGPTEDDETPPKPGSPRAVHTGLPRFVRVAKRKGERMVGLDYMNMMIIVVVYSLVAMINLGSTDVPDSYWRSRNKGEALTVTFSEEADLASTYYYPGVGKGSITIDLQPENEGEIAYSHTFETKEPQMYKWQTQETTGKAKSLTITAADANVFINEMAFYDTNGNMLQIESVTPEQNSFEETGNVHALFDEQELVDTEPDYMTEMYFDEIYHARTAFEHLKGIAPYENSHPPLGKVFIMIGIWIFGMNPFGWRIVGTLFGIFMLPLMYVFAKRIFRDTRFATLATLLFALDGMHFVQTRIATIDVYGVFFIMAMCYYMYRYWQMNFFVDSLRKTFVPLGLSGIMFGIGIASKWIGFYAGGGLAVALFTTFIFRYVEYRKAKVALEEGSETDTAFLQKMVDTYWKKVLLTCLFCVGFFIIIPLGIYLASYLPYILCAEKPYSLKDVWGVQTFMFNYHSKLVETHPFQSPWWQWPLIIRPIFYFSGKHLPDTMMSSIAAFGNPAVWWAGFICTIICIIMMVLRDRKLERRNTGFILICLGAALLPWVFITRATFIYHYFASVPFIILLTVVCAQRFVNKKGKLRLPVYILIGASLILFIFFYPVWSGWPIGLDYALTYMKWMPSWWFFKKRR